MQQNLVFSITFRDEGACGPTDGDRIQSEMAILVGLPR